MSILNVNKINPVGGGSTITITGIASVTNSVSVANSVTATSFHGSLTASNLTGALPALDGSNLTGIDATSIKPTKLEAVTELPTEILFVTLAIPAMVIVEPPPTGLILLTFSMLILFDYLSY